MSVAAFGGAEVAPLQSVATLSPHVGPSASPCSMDSPWELLAELVLGENFPCPRILTLGTPGVVQPSYGMLPSMRRGVPISSRG